MKPPYSNFLHFSEADVVVLALVTELRGLSLTEREAARVALLSLEIIERAKEKRDSASRPFLYVSGANQPSGGVRNVDAVFGVEALTDRIASIPRAAMVLDLVSFADDAIERISKVAADFLADATLGGLDALAERQRARSGETDK